MDEDYDNGKNRHYDDFGWPFWLGGFCVCCCLILFVIWVGVLTFQLNDLSNRVATLETSAGIASRRPGVAPASIKGAVQLDPQIADAVQRGNAGNSQRWSRLQAARTVEDEEKK